ncbi:hypothetical protein [Skermanella pratensis]|uniref:hypothetical protein n=1 Tax=Skermanella pratensis TaxID=2233999 RepID=UPI001301020B|nr:hypothetical protein [Skermanella pratensis]
MGKVHLFSVRLLSSAREHGTIGPGRCLTLEDRPKATQFREIIMENNTNHVIVLSSIVIAMLLLLVITA